MNEIYASLDEGSAIFGLDCSSFAMCLSEAKEGRAPSLESVCATLNPFALDTFPDGGPAPLSLCLKCGAYPHSRNERESSSIGSWKCVFCGCTNTDGISNPPPPVTTSIEVIEYTERLPCFEQINSNEERILHILTIDAVLFRDQSAKSMLLQSLSCLTTGSKMALIIVDEQLRIARLGQQSLVPLMIDVIPFSGSNLSKYLKTLTQSNQYLCPAEFVQSNFEAIFESLQSTFSSSVSTSSSSSSKSTLFCLNSLVSVCSQLCDSQGVAALSAKCLLVMCREFRVIEHSYDSRQVKCSRYANLGKKAYNGRCTFYAMQLGISALNVAGIDAFVSATGGFVVTAETVEDSAFVEVFQQILAKATATILPTDLATLEFRSTKSIEIERVTGPVAAIEDVIATKRARDKEFAEESVFLNDKHYTAALQSNESSAPGKTSGSSDFKKKYRKLAFSIKNSVACCGLFPREDADTSIAFQIRKFDSSNQDGKPGSLWSRLKKYPASLLQVDSSRSTKDHNFSTLPSEEDFVQVVARFSYCSVDSMRRLEKILVTRVWTIRFNCVQNKSDVLSNLNVPLWSFGVLRGVIADFHDEVEACFDGPRPHRSVETDYSKHKALKRKYEQQLDSWYRDIALDWKSTPVKVVQAARYFYHCLEGPLMDGPSASCQEAYSLRSLFLRSPFKLSRKVLMPSLRLDMNYFPSGSRKEQIISLKSMPPDSTSLLPMTFALLDVGDVIMVRKNVCTVEGECDFSADEAMDHLISFARDSSKKRFPACRVTILKQPGGPLDRMLLCRLSPSHLDATENILRRLRALHDCQSVSIEDIATSVGKMPITDQIYFQQFLALKSSFVKEEPVVPSVIPLTKLYPPPSSAPPLSSTITAMDRGIPQSSPIVDSSCIV